MTLADDGALTPYYQDAPLPCIACGEPVGASDEYDDIHDTCDLEEADR